MQLLRQGLIASVPDLPDEPGSRRASGWWIYAGAVALWGLDWWLLVESWNSTLALGGGLLVAVCGVVALAWLLLNPREDHQNVASMILLGAAVVWGGVLMGRLLANDYPGEPWALADGVCLWPGVVMRMVAGALAFYFVGRAWRDVCKWRSELTHRFFLEREGGIPGGVRHSSSKLAEGAQPATGHGVVPRDFPDHRGIDQGSNPFSDAPDNSANEAEVWAKYLDNSDPRRSRPAARWVRLTLAMLLVSCAAMLLAGFPAANSRGVVAKVGDFVSLGIALVGLVILCVFIGDQLWQCRRFVRRIWLHGTTGFGFELEEMLLLVSKVTAGAGNLLSYPFAVSFVLLCAHSGYFEQWFGLHGLYAMIGLALGTLALFTWKMQRTAHEVREKTVAHLKISLAEALWLKRLVLQRLDFAPQHKQEKSWWEYTVARLGRHIIIPEETRTAAVFRRYGGVPPMNDPQYAAFMAELKVSREIDTQFQEARIKRIEQLIAIATSLREGAFGSLKDNPIVRGILIPGAGLGSLELIQRLIVG